MRGKEFGTPYSATATGTTSATATKGAVAGIKNFITDISGSSDLTGATIQVLDGATVIWQDKIGNSVPYVIKFEEPLAGSVGNAISVVVTGTLASNANVSGYSL